MRWSELTLRNRASPDGDTISAGHLFNVEEALARSQDSCGRLSLGGAGRSTQDLRCAKRADRRLDLASVDGLRTEQGSSWSDGVFEAVGTVREGVLTVK